MINEKKTVFIPIHIIYMLLIVHKLNKNYSITYNAISILLNTRYSFICFLAFLNGVWPVASWVDGSINGTARILSMAADKRTMRIRKMGLIHPSSIIYGTLLSQIAGQ